jgi:hypothetical protein
VTERHDAQWAIGRFVLASLVVWSVGALVAFRLGGVDVAVGWGLAMPVCTLVGLGALGFVAWIRTREPVWVAKVLLGMPIVRMIVVGFVGWLAAGLITEQQFTAYWMSMVIAYLITLGFESVISLGLLRKPECA